MRLAKIRAILGRKRRKFARDPHRFLRSVSGVIHVGANSGQERETYERLGFRVLWIEPIPAVFRELESNIAQFPRQRALQALVTDRDNETYPFHIANNKGASSSILELKDHKDIWPDVAYTDTISLSSITLPSLLQQEKIDPVAYDALIMDTQGSELLVLKGAAPLLEHFNIVKTEVADFESYAGCCLLADVDHFMRSHGFKPCVRHVFARHKSGGRYYDVTYRKKSRWNRDK
ncbi:MAG: FkbM family methyltransferase [bacterium]